MTPHPTIWKHMTITAYLWSNPDLPHWLRLALFWFYLPLLLWCWLTGRPVVLAKYDEG